MTRHIIEIETKTFIRFWVVILGFALAAAFIWQAGTALIIIALAIFLAIAIRPLADRFEKLWKKPRPGLSAGLAFALVLAVLVLVVSVIAPTVVSETSKFIGQLTSNFESSESLIKNINDFGNVFGIVNLADQVSETMKSLASSLDFNSIVGTVTSSLGTIASFLGAVAMTLILTLMFLLQGPALMDKIWRLFRKKDNKSLPWVPEAKRITSRLANVIATYVSNQLTVALLDGVVVTVLVAILSLAFTGSASLALPMGLIAFVFFLIPMYGQVLGCILITVLLFFSSPGAAVIYAVIYLVYSQVEVNFIAPKIQGESLRLSPLVILISITIGTYMLGLLGAIIATPIAGCIRILIDEYPTLRSLREKSQSAS
ncbi:AI-2E family transporter [Candidatus Saccharibacteria bacterium]|nr:AI-2E family transporter [Candidatus Saccharibacteria bacterium]